MFATIHEIRSIEEVRPHLMGEGTLVIFDVDMVLVQSRDPAFQMPNMGANRTIVKKTMEGLSEAELDLLFNLMITQTGLTLVEERMPLFTEELKERGIPSIGLTGALAGKLAHVDNMTHWRHDTLKELGYDFSYSFPEINGIVFEHFTPKFGAYPTYHRGVIHTNGEGDDYNKGDVLLAFFTHANCRPKRILFLDDRRHNLDHVRDALQGLDPSIEFIGFHYLAGKEYPSPSLSEEEFLGKWSALLQTVKSFSATHQQQ